MSPPPYLDTSAFAKWYLNEPGSDRFEAYARAQDGALVARLGALEFRCLLARRRRSGALTAALEAEAFQVFQADVASGFLTLLTLRDEHAEAARRLIDRLSGHALRTLDALHLAIALDAAAETLATADAVMAQAAVDLGLRVERF